MSTDTNTSLPRPDLDAFRLEGFLAAPGFWSEEEILAMRQELDRLRGAGLLRNVATDADGKTHSTAAQNLQLCPMAPHSRVFRSMPFARKVVESVSALIGDPVVFHLDQVFLKPARSGSGTNWHQDNAYFHLPDPLKGTALWTAVHDATSANGTMRVIPAAFETLLDHSRDPMSDHHIRCYPDEVGAVTAEMAAGGALFFAYGTPHCTGPNLTATDRAGVALHFYNGSLDPAGAPPPEKRVWLTGPLADGGARAYGEDMRGVWEQTVSTSASCS